MHQEGGLIVDNEDTDGFASAVSFLLEHPALAIEMGEAGRRRVQAVFTWDRHLEAYDAVYRKLSKSQMTL